MDTLKSCYHQISDDEFAARLKQHAVEVYVNASNGDTVDHEQLEQPDFYNWCTQNIQESKNSVLKLADVVCAFTCTTCNLHSKESSKYKTQLEHFIHTHYPMIRHEHGIVTVGDKQYRGWKGLSIKPVNNKFFEWLENNVEFCENKVMKLNDVVETFLVYPNGIVREKSEYKTYIENYVKSKYQHIKHKYGKVRYQYDIGTTYGWKHLTLTQTVNV
jgi:hypothetical protein